jgi:hypothetical protein
MYRIRQPLVIVSFGVILVLIIVLLYYFRVSKEEGMWQPVYGDISKCFKEEEVSKDDVDGGGEVANEEEEDDNIVDVSKQLPGQMFSFKSFYQFPKDKGEWDSKKLQYLSLGILKDDEGPYKDDDVVFDKNGTMRWTINYPTSYADNVDPEFKKGVQICRSNKCINAWQKEENMDDSLFLKDRLEQGQAKDTWTIKKHGENKYTICTNVDLLNSDGTRNRSTLCMMPIIYGQNRFRKNVVIAEFADDYDPKPIFIWQIDPPIQ